MEIIGIFKALSDKTRLRIFWMLLHNKLCVCEIIEVLKMSQSRISRHMGILKQAGLINEERKGKWVIYNLSESLQKELIDYIRKKLKKDLICIEDKKRMDIVLQKKLCPFEK